MKWAVRHVVVLANKSIVAIGHIEVQGNSRKRYFPIQQTDLILRWQTAPPTFLFYLPPQCTLSNFYKAQSKPFFLLFLVFFSSRIIVDPYAENTFFVKPPVCKLRHFTFSRKKLQLDWMGNFHGSKCRLKIHTHPDMSYQLFMHFNYTIRKPEFV